MTVAQSTPHQAAKTPPSTPMRTRLAASAAIAAGVGIVLGHALTIDPNLPANTYVHRLAAHHVTGVAGGLLTAIGAFLLIPATTALLSLVRGKAARLATAAGILIGCGAAALGAGGVMITLVMGSLVQHHPDTATAVAHATDTEPLLTLPFALAPLLVIGLVIFGIALLRAKAVPVQEAALLIIGGLLVFISGGGGLLAALTLTPLGVALVLLGRRAAHCGR